MPLENALGALRDLTDAASERWNALMEAVPTGAERRAWLDRQDAALTDAVRYYGGPAAEPALNALTLAGEMSDAADVRDYYDYGGRAANALMQGDLWQGAQDAAQAGAAGLASFMPGVSASGLQAGTGAALGIFAGVKAANAPTDMLRRAEEMTAAGANRDDVWRETGWFQGVDGKWRWEIEDSDAFLESPANAPEGFQRLQHDDLQDAYPEMWAKTQQSISDRPISGQMEGAAGYYQPDIGAVVVGQPNAQARRSTALHEFQHAVQQQEGFASGSSRSAAERDMRLAQEADLAAFRERNPSLASLLNARDRAAESLAERYGPNFSDVAPEQDLRIWENLLEKVERHPKFDEYWKIETASVGDPLDLYRRTAGEVEARNVQARRNFAPEYRRETPPWATQDVPDDEQIVRMLR
ncbi:LPD23 domain-containing protein [Albimonas pacifica]|uniref:Large polyvalent protein associated domain-containing protein n=1 Tax=Albimonas pacifica TaxID=1114924 RepID=A0A1I3LHZ4_9RHOB|nr:LPD23 domain-containing protein [Albimonas pacifica]SFI84327.1 hypothetical protein SAMN05216258_11037 [Albimonas pacifica]